MATDPPRRGLRAVVSHLRHPATKTLAALGILVIVVVYLVVPQVREALSSLGLLRRVHGTFIVAGVTLEVASFVAYGLFTRSVLPDKGRPTWHKLLRIDVVGSGLSHILPGGGAMASGVRWRMLRKSGVDPAAAALGSIVQGVGSVIVVIFLMLLGMVLTTGDRASNPLYTTAMITGAGVLVLSALLGVLLWHGERFLAVASERCLPRYGMSVSNGVHRASARLRELSRDWKLLVRAALWATANWALDAASLWVFVAAFGHRVSFGAIVLAFGLANTLAVLPVTPGGLGILEGVLIPTLVAFGTPNDVAVLGVLTWRLVNFWAPIPAAGVSWLSLHLEGRYQQRAQSLAFTRTR